MALAKQSHAYRPRGVRCFTIKPIIRVIDPVLNLYPSIIVDTQLNSSNAGNTRLFHLRMTLLVSLLTFGLDW